MSDVSQSADLYKPYPEAEPDTPTYGDYGKTLGAGVTGGVLAPAAALSRSATENSDNPGGRFINAMSKVLQQHLNSATEDLDSSRSEVAQERAGSAVTSAQFWEHPISAAMLKATGMAPAVAAMMFSGGPIGAAIVGGAMSGGSYLNDVDKAIDDAPEDKLKENKWYATQRANGMSDEDARTDLKEKVTKYKGILNFAVGALAGAIGPAGKLAAGVAGKAAAGVAGAETGVVGRAAAGAAEGAIGGGLQGGVENATVQQATIDTGLKKDFDKEALVNAVLEPAGFAGVMGAGAGAIVGGKGKPKAKDVTKDVVPTETPTAQEQGGGPNNAPIQAAAKASTEATPDSGNPAQTPPPQVSGAKGEAIKAKGKAPAAEPSSGATIVDVKGPTPEEALALKPKTSPEVPADVAKAATNPEFQQQQPKTAPTVETPKTAPEVPPDVAAASQRQSQPSAQPTPPPVTPEVTAAPQSAPVSSVAPVKPVAPTGRVLKDMSEQGRAKDKAAKDKAAEDLKAATAAEKEAATKKYSEAEKASISQRAAHAEEIFNAVPKSDRELPTTPADRKAMVADLDKTLAAAAERGLVPRESLPKDTQKTNPHAFNLSIPQKVGDAGMSPHVRYLREVMDVKKALENKAYGPKSKARARVLDFINDRGDLEALAERRKVDGAAAKTVHQGDVEAPSGKVAESMASGDHTNESTMSPEDLLAKRQEEAAKEAAASNILAAAKEGRVSDEEAAATKEAEAEVAAKEKFDRKRAAHEAALQSRTKRPAEEIAAIKEKAAAKPKAADEPVAAPVKKVTVSDEMKAKYLAMSEKAKNKPEHIDAKLTDTQTPKDRKTGEPIKVIKTITARDALESLDLQHLSGVPKALADFAKRRLSAMAGDSPVHIVAKEEMARHEGDLGIALQKNGSGDIGLHRLNLSGEGHYTLVRHDALHTPESTAHVVIHEITHAATMRAIHENPEIHKTIEHMMGEVRDYARTLPPDITKRLDYAMSNTREFVAEAFSNPDVQEILSHIPMSDKLSARLGMEKTHRLSVWDAMVNVVRGIIEKTTGRLPDGHRMVEGIMRMGEKIARENDHTAMREREAGGPIRLKLHGLEDGANLDAKLNVGEIKDRAAEALKDQSTNVGGMLRRGGRKLLTNHMIADGAEKHVGEGVKKLIDLQAMKDREKDNILNSHGGAEVVRRQAELERSHPEDMAKANDLIFDASNHNVNLGPNADNTHLGKNATKGWQSKKVLPELQRRYNKLAPEVQEHLQKSVKFFRDVHNEVSRAVIDNVLESAGIKDAALAERIFKDGVTDADKAQFGDKSGIVSALNAATNLKEMKGWYAPFRRYGDFVSSAEHELSVPANATKIDDNTLQFTNSNKAQAARDVKKYVEQDAHTPQGNQLKNTNIEKVWVDKNDPTKLLDSSDVNSMQAYRVKMQTQHTEFHDTEAQANNNRDLLQEAGLKDARSNIRAEAHRSAPGMEGALGSVIRSLERNESYNKLDATQKAAVKQSLMDASVSALGSTNIKSSMAHRRNVAGMSRDLGRVTADYARMTANYLAGLRFGPKIAGAFDQMRKHIDGISDKDNIRRNEIYDELHNRVYGAAGALADRAPNPVTRKLLQVSRLARLAGVSFHVINSMEPLTTSLPMIGGRHGFGAATKAILETYNIIGGAGAIKAGLRDTAKAFTDNHGFTDYVGLFKDNIAKSNTMGGAMSKFMMDTLDYANERNLWGNDAIFEVGQTADPSGNLASRALDRADRMANQVGAAVEGNNRAVTLLAAARLELKRNGGNAEAAKAYAYKMAVETMGDYSAWNASPIFNSGAGKMALQFKKFAQKSYYMLGKTMKGTLQGDPESAKQFVGLMMTHALVAGALGLPGLEPFKVALMVSNAFSLSGYDPGNFDNDVRTLAARVFGAKGGEMVSHGIFRGIGIEVSNRLGWDNLLTYGNPKSNKPNDVKAWLWDTIAGAPAGYLLDQIKTATSLAKGDVAGAIATASPIRAVSDLAKAYSGASGPKLSPTGVEQHAALTPYQTGVRALGFTPAVTAEDGAMRGAVASDTKKLTADRSGLVNAWVNAKPSEKSSAWRDVQKWNAGQDKDARIAMTDLTNAAKRRAKSEADGTTKNGIHVSKRTKAIYNSAASTYNP
jgi:hypothetical protein